MSFSGKLSSLPQISQIKRHSVAEPTPPQEKLDRMMRKVFGKRLNSED